jgi:sialic acid synthase SpsE
MDLAELMIRSAKGAGADAVKFQNYLTADFLTDDTLTHTYTSQGRQVTEPQRAMFGRCELSQDDLERLKKCCDDIGIMFISTPTNNDGVDALARLNSPYLKNGSDYLGHLPLIQHMARTGLPTILSTGMATQADIDEAVHTFRDAGGKELILLACTSSYPTPPDQANLLKLSSLAQRYGCAVGFSDHTEGWMAAVGSVCLGATVIEKHFTSDRNLPGPDQWFSSDPAEFAELVCRVRQMETLMGTGDLKPTANELQHLSGSKLSCVAAHDLPAGSVITEAEITFRRPATGLRPALAARLKGTVLKQAMKSGTPFTEENLQA